MPDKFEVTVVVVSYRHSRYIVQCLESILEQTVTCRLIVIDDHSPDDTQRVIRQFFRERELGDRVTLLLQEENKGLPANLNVALSLTDTEYFVYLAGDDWSVPTRLEKQIAAMDARGPNAGLCYSDCLRAREDGTLHTELFSQNHAYVFRPQSENPYRDLLLVDNWIPAPTVMFRTSALRKAGGFDERIRYEDHDSYVRVSREHDVVYVDEPLSVHRELEDGLGTQIFRPDSRDWLEGQLIMECKQLGHDPAIDAELAPRVRVRAIRLFKMGGNPRLSAAALRQVLRTRRHVDPVLWAYWSAASIASFFQPHAADRRIP